VNVSGAQENRWHFFVAGAAIAFCLLGLSACDWPGRPVLSETNENFDSLYKTNCAGCHGADGKLGPAPPLNDPIFLAIVPDKELRRVISDGRSVTPEQKSQMPAFAVARGGALTDAQIKLLVSGLKEKWGPGKTPTPSAPPYLAQGPGNMERGGDVFMRACMGCHGEDGEGIEKEGRLAHRLKEPAFLALISDQALRRIIITGRPDLGMPSYDEKRPKQPHFKPLTSTEVADVVALLAYWRQGGAAKEK
jgi:mono/diheme cytochrome c family protein